jgi:serine/threonine-protein kinase
LPGLVKISDFGLARVATPPDASPDTTSGSLVGRENTVMGTPDYLSPEQTRSLQQTDVRSDMYSLGCTFYFLLTGQVPFPGGSALDKMIRHNTELPAPLSKYRPDVPPQVAAIVSRLLAKRPEDRFQTAEELASALQPFAVSGPTPWAPPRANDPGPDDSGITSAKDLALEVEEELSALAGTLPPTMDETPRPESPSRMYRQRGQQGSSVQVALIIAISIIAGLLAILGLMALVTR